MKKLTDILLILQNRATLLLNHPQVKAGLEKFRSLDWTERVYALIIVAGLLLFLFGPYALLFRHTNLITYEATKRGEALIHLLAASNQNAFSNGEEVLYSVKSVADEYGVHSALVTSLEGMIVAPIERFGQQLDGFKEMASPVKCTQHNNGSRLNFFCPIFKWVEKDQGYVKEAVGMAYLNYAPNESLDLMGSRVFRVIHALVLFATVLGVLAYSLVQMTQKSIVDLRYNVLAFHRGGSNTLNAPEKFQALEELTDEIRTALGSRESVGAGDSSTLNLDEILPKLADVFGLEVLLISADKQILFASEKIKTLTKVEEHKHLLRACKQSPYEKELLAFFTALLEDGNQLPTLILPELGDFVGHQLSVGGQDYLLVIQARGPQAQVPQS